MNLVENFKKLTELTKTGKEFLRVESRKNEKEREFYYHLSNRYFRGMISINIGNVIFSSFLQFRREISKLYEQR